MGKAVKIRHCAATVKDSFLSRETIAEFNMPLGVAPIQHHDHFS